MIVSRTPYRISFFGGGTDYPAWYRMHGGSVLATTINKYCYLTCRYLPPFHDHRIRVVYSKVELCQTIDEIAHPAVREVLRYLDIRRGVEIHHEGDLPAGTGMGSSSAFTVGLLHALYGLKGVMPSKRQLAVESIHVEQDLLKETVGSQDQISAAYGGLNHITFDSNGEMSVRPVTIKAQRLQELNAHLMLFYAGQRRIASTIAETYVRNIEEKKRQLRVMKDLVDEALNLLQTDRDLTAFGELLNEGWQLKRTLSDNVSNTHVDDLYDRARAAGAVGGKLTGAGGGGFLMLFVPPGRRAAVGEALRGFVHVTFRFESTGSQIIFFDPEEDYADEEEIRRGSLGAEGVGAPRFQGENTSPAST